MLLAEYRVSERRACATVFLHRSVYRYVDQPRDDRAVRQRMKEIAETRVRYGVNRIHILLRREGWRDNHKRTYRIYKEEGLNLRSKRPRRNKTAAHRQQRPLLTGPHQCWSMDFVSDQLSDGRRFRALTLVDNYSRECLKIEVGQNLRRITSQSDPSIPRFLALHKSANTRITAPNGAKYDSQGQARSASPLGNRIKS